MKWVEFFHKNKNANLRLICSHYAGGGASAFYQWQKYLPANIEVAAIQLPGRESRFGESLFNNMKDIINELCENFTSCLDKPFILFGHSLGALICFELTRKLQKQALLLPEHLILSGCKAPHIQRRRKAIHTLPDKEFIKELMQYNGMPNEILDCEEILNLFLPIIRADFTVSETYCYTDVDILPVNITAISGCHDSTVLEADMKEWSRYTCKNFSHFSLEGDHFFIKSAQEKLLDIIKAVASTSSGNVKVSNFICES